MADDEKNGLNNTNTTSGTGGGNFTRRNLTSTGNFSRQSLSGNISQKPEVKVNNSQPEPQVQKEEKTEKKPEKKIERKVSLNKNPTAKLQLGSGGKSVLEGQEAVVVVGEEKKKKKKIKIPKLAFRISALVLVIIVFLTACGFAVFAISGIIAKKDSDKVFTDFIVNADDGISYSVNERVYSDSANLNGHFMTEERSGKELKFKWVNESTKVFELQVSYDRLKVLRFRQYNTFASNYTSEKLFNVDFVTYTVNFDSKFTLADDGYYYLNKNAQSGSTFTVVVVIDFRIDDYHGQFDGVHVDEIFEIQQSANPDSDWGYYSYLFKN